MEEGAINPDSTVCHVVAMPYPGRGHINPLMNLCKLLVSRKPNNFIVTFIVTDEWLGYIASDPKPDSIRFATIPNILPSENVRALDFPAFYESVMTKLEAPFDHLLRHLHPPVTAMISDVELLWAIELGNRRNIPVATLSTMSATFFSMLYHLHLFAQDVQSSPVNLLENADYIPGISSSDLAELQTMFLKYDLRVIQLLLECISKVEKAQYLLFTSVYELEGKQVETLKPILPIPIYLVGPSIPYLELEANDGHSSPDYQQWLDSQPQGSVLYISMGSFLSVSTNQMDEIVAGIQESGVRYLWIARGETSRLKEISNGDKGLVLPWCDQLKVLCHSSVGGFWTHCGWNSTLEAVFAGVPLLTFPLFLDQFSNSKQILDIWRTGSKVQGLIGEENLVTREEIAQLVQKFMDLESSETKELRQRARAIRDICQQAIALGGSSATNVDTFIRNITRRNCP
ncbi:UDP-glycosyltransferase 87A1-like isoform X2 [Euphorbia lathyris]|uniref:UDP-glycosyltransferase 87A1-like isoform X2 n=1 Tax=Euphorbia lathyris TaxID=212925 RepID=UPI003313B9A4